MPHSTQGDTEVLGPPGVGGRWAAVEPSGWTSGIFRHGSLVADRHGRPVTATSCPTTGVRRYLTVDGRLVALDPAAQEAERATFAGRWRLRAGLTRLLVLWRRGLISWRAGPR